MKKIIFMLSLVSLLAAYACKPKAQTQADTDTEIKTVDNSRTSLDWPGRYKGVIPCADCSGIEITIVLNADLTYKKTDRYIDTDDSYESSGSFKWDEDGGIVTLSNVRTDSEPNRYKVGEGKLIRLDMEGNEIEGLHAERYILSKVED